MMTNAYLCGCDILGAPDLKLLALEPIEVLGASYTDAVTVRAVQEKLRTRALEGTGASWAEVDPIEIDGIYGPHTKAAIEALQGIYGVPKTGVIDEWVLMTLNVEKKPAYTAVFDPGFKQSKEIPKTSAPPAPRTASVPPLLTPPTLPVLKAAKTPTWKYAVGAVAALAVLGGGVLAVRQSAVRL